MSPPIPWERFTRVLLSWVLFLFPCCMAAGSETQDPIDLITFGSCVYQEYPQDFWGSLVAEHSDLFLFLGDNVYADTRDRRVMQSRYRQLGGQPGFQSLKESTPLLAIWDDHDFGENDAGADYPMAAVSEQIFLDFFGVPANSKRRLHPGIYGSHMYGPVGARVQIILLDTRRFRGPWTKSPKKRQWGKYIPNEDPDIPMLGKSQWQWLERELRRPAEVRIIASGIQVIPEDHGWETWANLPMERARLFRTIRDANADGVILLSGDRHLAEFSSLPADAPDGVGYPLWEVTSSSLTHGINRPVMEPNKFRVGENFTGNNYGRMSIDWAGPESSITLDILDTQGAVQRTQRIRLRDLRRKP